MSKDVYLMAAELMDAKEASHGSCYAIQRAYAISRGLCFITNACIRKSDSYGKLFRPDFHNGSWWGEAWGNVKERKQCRVLALLFMHWISQDSK